MKESCLHRFHIPVMGLGFTIDTPVKVARFGISSVLSIVEDELIEKMRSVYAVTSYLPIAKGEADYRARRITAYLNLVDEIVKKQVDELKQLPFEQGNELAAYFELLPEDSIVKKEYLEMMNLPDGVEKQERQNALRNFIQAGSIDVNIMCKVNKQNYAKDGTPLPKEYNDALASLRGFANSTLVSSVVLSAGYSPDLYAYIAELPCFLPDATGRLAKKIILKVSDFRSARTQGKLLAKKGVWVSEFRVESGLNCGGHAFATDGLLLGPILDEFKEKRKELEAELFLMLNEALEKTGRNTVATSPGIRLSVQGGVGTAAEQELLLQHYGVDSVGWGSPFLLVPEATNVETETLMQLATAAKEDYFLSDASPLGVPFHNFRKSSSEQQRAERIAKGRPGSPCYKEHLVTDTTFSERPICTASRKYLHLKLQELDTQQLPAAEHEAAAQLLTAKDCLCEGLSASALLKNGVQPDHKLTAVAVCPGPNLAYFSGVFSLQQMVGHIYGRTNLLNAQRRPWMFINELDLYIDYLKKEIRKLQVSACKTNTAIRSVQTFQANLLKGILYYRNLLPAIFPGPDNCVDDIDRDFAEREQAIRELEVNV